MWRKLIVCMLVALSCLSAIRSEPEVQSTDRSGKFFLDTLLGGNRYPTYRPPYGSQYPGMGYGGGSLYPGSGSYPGGSGMYPGGTGMYPGGAGMYPGGTGMYPGGAGMYPGSGGYGTNFIGNGYGGMGDIPFNDTQTFNEIGSLSRIKRQVKFPDDITEKAIDDVEGHSIDISEAIEGKALKQTLQSVTKIDVGAQSQLMIAPGSTAQIFFEVTNLRTEPSYHTFQVQDERRYLRDLQPRFLLLAPNQKETVRVTLMVPQGAELGTKDTVTLTSQGVVRAMQAATVTVSTNGITDPWPPHVWYTYNTRCDWRQNCVGGTWSIEVVARDYESGLLSLRSNPEGLLLRAPYVAGTNEEVKATYSASCCEPRVTITATDLNRNQRTIQLNVDEPWLSEYGIATVVLGVLFFILLIILIVIWIVWCVRRRRIERDLPTYRQGDVRP